MHKYKIILTKAFSVINITKIPNIFEMPRSRSTICYVICQTDSAFTFVIAEIIEIIEYESRETQDG